ncbi:MAG: hypothetical protein ACOYKE_03005 [Ferruginibacter sp.]
MRMLYVVILSLFAMQIEAQKVVMLHKANGLQQAFYSNQPLLDAYTAAGNEDTIYLPGGSFVAPDFNKRLTIYGAGHYPDSTGVTGKTIIANGFTIGSAADSFHLEGVECNADIYIEGNVNYLNFKRNNLGSVSYSTAPVSSYSRMEGNVIRGALNFTHATNVLLVNNIIAGQVILAKNGDVIRNNVFLTEYPINSCSYALFENNIFLGTITSFLSTYTNDYNVFSNNVFTMTPTWLLNQNYSNYTNVAAANLLVNQTGTSFSYLHNYHLQNAGSYLGVDAIQCGIYGGFFGYKEGAVPTNPHIRQKTIANTTNAIGELNVNITVAAQNN